MAELVFFLTELTHSFVLPFLVEAGIVGVISFFLVL
jgi:hypothetical protein